MVSWPALLVNSWPAVGLVAAERATGELPKRGQYRYFLTRQDSMDSGFAGRQ